MMQLACNLGAQIRWRARHLQSQQAMVLVYHRIAAVGSGRWSLCTTPERFEAHLRLLRRYARLIPISQFVTELVAGHLKKGSVAITFDDGYADNVQTALPILRQHDVPAAFYLVGRSVGSNREFWWDDLERCLLEPVQVPSRLTVDLKGDALDIDVGVDPSGRKQLFDKLWSQCKSLSGGERDELIDTLREWAGVSSQARPSHRPLNEAEVISLAGEPLAEIGAHTDSHPRLSDLAPAEQRSEIVDGRNRLESLIGRQIDGFAYPFGHPSDYGPGVVQLLRSLGFRYALRVGSRIPRHDPDPFQVPRVYMTNEDGDDFARLMHDRIGIRVA